jgi:hypothetical protein
MLSATKNIKNIRRRAKYDFQVIPTSGKAKPKTMLTTTIKDVKYLLIRASIHRGLPTVANTALHTALKVNSSNAL